MQFKRGVGVAGLVLGLSAFAGVVSAADRLADVSVSADALAVRPFVDADSVQIRVSGPGGVVLTREFGRRESPVLELAGAKGEPLGDGAYNYEVVLAPRLDAGTRAAMDAARSRGESGPSLDAMIVRGSFRIQDGGLVTGPDTEGPAPAPEPDDQVIPDDLIVQGSICVGLDCVNNENFGFDTIRLKENNTRINFTDTSVGTFPSNDWELTANDSASGGASRFSIADITGVKTPFTVTAGAATSSIFVDSTGRVGFRTSTPVLDLHVATGNTPALRLEQNSSSGFTAQTWDVAGNEANFFVRDVTGGSRLSFRIRPGAPTSSIDISSDGDTGIGTGSPAEKLHVLGSDGSNKILVEETNVTAALRNMFTMKNNGGIQLLFDRTDGTANDWQMSNFNATFQVSVPGAGTPQLSLSSTGDLTIGGTNYNTGSSRDIKENFEAVDGVEILRRLVEMPLTEWSGKADPSQRHIGPIAEDWWATFGLGPDDKHVSMTDIGGVALAAIKGLHQVVADKDAQLEELSERLAALEAQVRSAGGK